jgi:hypothetical protein
MRNAKFTPLAVLAAFFVGCSDQKPKAESASPPDIVTLDERSGALPLLESKLSVGEVQEMVRSGVTPEELRTRIGSIPVIHGGAARYGLKDGRAKLAFSLVEDEMIARTAVVAVRHNKAEQGSAHQSTTRPESKSE